MCVFNVHCLYRPVQYYSVRFKGRNSVIGIIILLYRMIKCCISSALEQRAVILRGTGIGVTYFRDVSCPPRISSVARQQQSLAPSQEVAVLMDVLPGHV